MIRILSLLISALFLCMYMMTGSTTYGILTSVFLVVSWLFVAKVKIEEVEKRYGESPDYFHYFIGEE